MFFSDVFSVESREPEQPESKMKTDCCAHHAKGIWQRLISEGNSKLLKGGGTGDGVSLVGPRQSPLFFSPLPGFLVSMMNCVVSAERQAVTVLCLGK